MLLAGKTAVVTGSNRGIGRAVVTLMARHGAAIFACARTRSEEFSRLLDETRSATGARLVPVYFDLSDAAAVKDGVRTILAERTSIDILVNNAGVIHTAPFAMTTVDTMRTNLEINYVAPMMLTQLLCRTMVRQKSGSIVNVSSSAAIEGNEGRLAYAGAKAALIASTKVMARELGGANIRVNAVAPGLTQTDMMTDSTPPAALEATLQRIAMKRVGRPEEVAGAILYLASELSTYVTGQVLRVDGGL